MRLIGIDAFRAEGRRLDPKRVGGVGFRPAKDSAGVFAISTVEPKAYDEASRKIRFCFSDGSVDRMGDTIDPQGWRLNDFNANPVALWAHDSSAPPIGRASNLLVEDSRLMGDITFADVETYAFADTIYRLTLGKFINAVSVGFLPVVYEWSKDEDREWGIDFKVHELLEISVCPVPANPNALGDARSKGIDTRPLVEWAERVLAGGGKMILPRAEVERLRKAAKEPVRPRRRVTGAGEADPADGGALVGIDARCARGADEDCGMIDPQECAVHRKSETDEKRIARLVARGVAAELKRLGIGKGKLRQRADGDEEGDDDGPEMKPEHEASMRRAMDHLDAAEAGFKAADEHYDNGDDAHDDAVEHHQAAMDEISTICAAIDESDGDDDDKPADEEEKAKARRLRKAKRLAARLGA